ncbi:DUF4279 domain-containing protein [Streptomyces avidinii]|uniref:Uncharacterized protein n=1 Tax=Streptomyces avidinii TaxID=1895 RepID=A0ABS4KXL6_STRAV|nr:DUF4279 domain-containing protein [Streptomyces avidinii]MBP2034773.1 hypothetical protein [Streptomyces avidinii]GGY88774.1 hypothetical protein GCM10010343_12420 [Streptomyces avidinii]
MPLDQYVYFALSSERTSAQEMTALLGIEPDETTVRGSRRTEPAIPVCHSWKVVCREPGLRVDDQVAHVLDRLRPHTDRIAKLARQLNQEPEPGSAARLQIVRYFRDAEGKPGRIRRTPRRVPISSAGIWIGTCWTSLP